MNLTKIKSEITRRIEELDRLEASGGFNTPLVGERTKLKISRRDA